MTFSDNLPIPILDSSPDLCYLTGLGNEEVRIPSVAVETKGDSIRPTLLQIFIFQVQNWEIRPQNILETAWQIFYALFTARVGIS